MITAFLLILPLTNISHPHEEDPYTTYIQEKLIDLGFLDTATGINDKNTQEAIKIFQEKAGLVVDGMVGNLTFPKLLLGEKAYSSSLMNKDNNPPVWSSDPLTIININQSSGQKSTSMSATVLWGHVTDDVGIDEYKIYVDGELYTSIPGDGCLMKCSSLSSGKSARILNLIKDKNQTIKVSACDYEGNCSTNNPTITKYFTIDNSGGGGQSRLGGSTPGFLVTFGGSQVETDIAGVAVDSSDNIYITGTSLGTNVFGSSVTSGTSDNIFVVKLNSSGVIQWVYTAGGNGRDRGRKIALDSSGNVYVVGYYQNTVDFGGGNVTSNQSFDAFILKLNSSGTFQWVKSYGGSNGNDLGRDVAIDSSDNVYMLGAFRTTVDFGGGNVTSNGNADVFLVKLNSSGVFQWVYTAGGTGDDGVRALALDSGDNPYITGNFASTVNFGSGNITAANSNDLFILKLNSSGAYQNIYTSNIDTTTKAKGLFIDSSGNIYATGTFQNTVNFGGGNITTSGKDIYLLKLNSSFAFQWVKRFAVDNGEAGPAIGTAVTVDEDGNVYSVGEIAGTFDLGGGTQALGSNEEAYIVKHDSSGTFQWSKTFGGVGGYDNRVQDIVIDSNDFIIAVGGITGNTNFITVGGDTIDFSDLEHNWVLKIKSATGVID